MRIARDLEQERNEPAKETRAPSSAVPIVVPSVKERQKALQTRNPQVRMACTRWTLDDDVGCDLSVDVLLCITPCSCNPLDFLFGFF